MAAGDVLAVALRPSAPGANSATFDWRTGGSTPGEKFPVIDFDAASDEYMDFIGRLPDTYGGGGLDVDFIWSATSATSGDVLWKAAFRRLDAAEDIDTSHAYSFQSNPETAPGTSGVGKYSTIPFSNVQIDSLAAGEAFVLRIFRDADDAADTMTGDAELWLDSLQIVET